MNSKNRRAGQGLLAPVKPDGHPSRMKCSLFAHPKKARSARAVLFRSVPFRSVPFRSVPFRSVKIVALSRIAVKPLWVFSCFLN